jgi:hypothetical protein
MASNHYFSLLVRAETFILTFPAFIGGKIDEMCQRYAIYVLLKLVVIKLINY